jgi:hypothetical protein
MRTWCHTNRCGIEDDAPVPLVLRACRAGICATDPTGEEVGAVTDAYPESFPLSADQETEDDPEGFAQEAGLDPTVQEVDEYRKKIGDLPSDAQEE